MLGTLSLMACTLMLAAVPSLSSSMQPCDEVNLPAIGYVMADDVRTGINPLEVGEWIDISGELVAADYIFYLGDGRAIYPVSADVQGLWFLVNYGSDGLDVENYSDEDFGTPTGILNLVVPSGTAGVSIYLPDLSYWESSESDDSYYLYVMVHTGSELSCVYANIFDSWSVTYELAELGDGVDPIGAIGDGLGIVGALGGALSDGFDGVFLDNGALTSVGTFSFVLLGLGISVGIVKKCFNWVTGRHGM